MDKVSFLKDVKVHNLEVDQAIKFASGFDFVSDGKSVVIHPSVVNDDKMFVPFLAGEMDGTNLVCIITDLMQIVAKSLVLPSSITLNNTELTETQLQQLLAVLNNDLSGGEY